VVCQDGRYDGVSPEALGNRGEEVDGCWERKEEALGGAEEDVAERSVPEGESLVSPLKNWSKAWKRGFEWTGEKTRRSLSVKARPMRRERKKAVRLTLALEYDQKLMYDLPPL
jgi:hypothetical protein